jgi:hypothetical protein
MNGEDDAMNMRLRREKLKTHNEMKEERMEGKTEAL